MPHVDSRWMVFSLALCLCVRLLHTFTALFLLLSCQRPEEHRRSLEATDGVGARTPHSLTVSLNPKFITGRGQMGIQSTLTPMDCDLPSCCL